MRRSRPDREWEAALAGPGARTHGTEEPPVFLRPDGAIRQDIVHDVLERTLFVAPAAVQVQVRDGVVTLRGTVERQSLVTIAVRLCRALDGVVAVHDQLDYRFDDRRIDLGPNQYHGILHTSRR